MLSIEVSQVMGDHTPSATLLTPPPVQHVALQVCPTQISEEPLSVELVVKGSDEPCTPKSTSQMSRLSQNSFRKVRPMAVVRRADSENHLSIASNNSKRNNVDLRKGNI